MLCQLILLSFFLEFIMELITEEKGEIEKEEEEEPLINKRRETQRK